jgi:hypothetical protein
MATAGAGRRRRRACQAALEVADGLGIAAQHAVVLRDWNNTIIRLAPAPVIAKVRTSHFRDAGLESLERELSVATHLANCEAPVIPPTRQVPPGPHRCQGLMLTLWRYVEPIPRAAGPAETATAINSVHEALADFNGPLPDFRVELDDARGFLQPHRSPTLEPADRWFLVGVIDELQAALANLDAACHPLHGSPHQANWLSSADGPLLHDFETACCGPVEWDLAALDDDVVDFFPDTNRELIAAMRRMRSVCVAAKCWIAPERAPELREAAHVHLKLLRGQPVEENSG